MRRLHRTVPTQEEANWLKKQTKLILDKPEAERKAESDRLWSSAKQNQQRNQLRHIHVRLQDMASGLQRCMYCEDSQGTAIEHFWPRAKAPEKTFVWENLLYACGLCNSNYKRDQFPMQDDQPLLIDPTVEEPLDHLVLVPKTGKFEPRIDAETEQESAKGKASIETFGLCRKVLEDGRRDAWAGVQAYIIQYDTSLSAGKQQYAEALRMAICNRPFSGVLVYLLRVAALYPVPPAAMLQADCIAALDRRPEIAGWLDISPPQSV